MQEFRGWVLFSETPHFKGSVCSIVTIYFQLIVLNSHPPKFKMNEASKLIQVGELSVGFSENILSDTDELQGKSVTLVFEDGSEIFYHFHSKSALTWKTNSTSNDEDYRATSPRKDIFLVDYIKKNVTASSVSLVLDFNTGVATSLTGSLPDKKEAHMDKLARVAKGMPQTAVKAVFQSATINQKFTENSRRHEKTTELVGKRVLYRYSHKDTYEHIYLNETRYTWHCLSGVEKGMADTEICHYFKIAHDLYLFVWREKLVPTLGVVVVDLEVMKTTGKIFGYESEDNSKLTNFPIGADAQFANLGTGVK